MIGTAETLTATALAGVFYSLFAAQPLIPIGPTGPLLVFDEILFTVCTRKHHIYHSILNCHFFTQIQLK